MENHQGTVTETEERDTETRRHGEPQCITLSKYHFETMREFDNPEKN